MKFLNNQWITGVQYREELNGDGGDSGAGGGGGDGGDSGEDTGSGDGSGGGSDTGTGGQGDGSGDGGTGDGDAGGTGDGDGGGTPRWIESTPDDWRNQIAGDDEKKLKRLERFTDINHYLTNSFDEHDRLRQGELSGARPDGSDEEALTAWRGANGIPNDGNYTIVNPEGIETVPEDARIMQAIMPIALAADVSEATLNALNEGMLKARQTEVDNLIAQDGLDAQQREQLLRDTWKGDYDVNVQAVENFLNRELPEDLRENFRRARGGDGKGLFNNPAVLAMFAKVERTLNPMSTIPGGGNNDVQSARQIVDEAKKLFKNDMKAYQDPAFQKKYDAAIEYLQSQGEKI